MAKQALETQPLVTAKITPLTLKMGRLIAAINEEKLYEVLERAVGRELRHVAPEARKALRLHLKARKIT